MSVNLTLISVRLSLDDDGVKTRTEMSDRINLICRVSAGLISFFIFIRLLGNKSALFMGTCFEQHHAVI